jgi:hypothetical protein
MIPRIRPEFALILLAAVPFDGSRWAHRAPLSLPQGHAGGYAEFALNAETYHRAAGSLADLRVVSSGGAEVPYVFDHGRRDPVLLRPRMIDRVQTPKGELRLVLDFGRTRQLHNKLRLNWSERNFRRSARIESSEDQNEWNLVKEVMLLDFRQDGLFFQTREISYPESSSRYLRLTISGWSDPAALTGVESVEEPQAARRYTELASPAIRPSPAVPEDAKGDTAIEFDVPRGALTPVQVRLQVEGGEFVRTVLLHTKTEGRPWWQVCQGTIARAGEERQETIECGALPEGRVRLVVRNRDNQPARVTGVRILTPERRMLIRANEPGPYWLYAGNSAAAPPQYDLAAVLARSPVARPVSASLGQWEANPGYRPPPVPFSEQFRGWLIPLLSVLVVVIAVGAGLLLRKSA